MKYLVIYLLPVILVLFMGSSILSANSAFGLSCDATNMTWSFEETDAIFLGKALSKEYQPNPIHEDRFDAVTLFSIIGPYKGIYQKEISIISSEWLWGVNFTENSDYVVFANNNDGMFEHALCTPTLLASESNMLEIQKISQRYILPPLVQSELGVSSNEIQCKQNLVLIQKYDGSPACVTESTKTKLIERGWTENHSSTYSKPDSTTSKSQLDAVPVGEKYSTGGILRYEKTVPVIDDTYLLHSVKYWQDVPREVLEAEYEVQDDFYMELGRLLVKNEMAYQMQRLGIENSNDDFKVYSGAVDESLPPHIYYDAIVNGTDGKTYRLQGAAHANRVNYYATEELKFHDTTQQISIHEILTKPQLVTILPKNGFESSQEPKIVIIHMNNRQVEFFNDSSVTVRIQDHGSGKISDEHELEWIGHTLKPNQRGHVTFNSTGIYEWDARTPPESDNPDWWGSYGKGTILVLPNQTNNLSTDKRIKMAGTMIMESELPISGLGMGKSDGLRIYFGDAIHEMLPDTVQYYENRIKQMVPFDVNVIIE